MQLPPEAASSRWTGYYQVQTAGPHDVFVHTSGENGGNYRVFVDDKLVLDNWTLNKALANYVTLPFSTGAHKVVLERRGRNQGFFGARTRLGIVRQGQFVSEEAKKLAAKVDVVVVAAGFDQDTESEGADRTFALPAGQDELIKEMAALNKNTIVVLTSGGSVDMNAWVDRVPSLIEAWYPGQQGGSALAEVLFGDVNPSGRLPVTFERRWEDNPVHDNYYPAENSKKVIYKEGVFVGYRGYEHANVKPLFPFGYGLSYSSFKYSNLTVKQVNSGAGAGPDFEVSFEVKNTGTREGAEVAQVYVGPKETAIPRPAKELKGFAKINLRPGESRKVSVTLDVRALSYYDVNEKQWRANAGEFDVLVGHSSEQIELRGTLKLSSAVASK
jgi:beta-glucosidase